MLKKSPITKTKLAERMEISLSSLRNLLNNHWYNEIAPLGYSKNSKIISPKVYSWICSEWFGKVDDTD